MKILSKILCLMVGCCLGSYGHASDLYLGLNYAKTDFSSNVIPEEASLDFIYGRFGSKLTRNVSAEFRLGKALSEDEVPSADVESTVHYGAYIRDGIHFGDVFFPFLMIGYSGGQFEVSNELSSEKITASGFSYGLGADFQVMKSFTISTEYLVYMNEADADLTGFSLGFVWHL